MGADREQEHGEVGEEDEGEGRRCSGARLMIEGSVGLRRNSVLEHRPLCCYYPGLAECEAIMWQFGARSLVPLDCF